MTLLPVAYRVGTYIYTERSNGREPIFDMSGIQLQPPNPGPYAGVPLGGLGSGSIGRGFRGEFRRWSLNPGRYSHQVVQADVFCVRVRCGNTVETKVLSMEKPSDRSCLKSWQWNMDPRCAKYYARFPYAWTVFENPVTRTKVVVKQTSPFIPGNYTDSCLPAAIFDVEVVNQHPTDDIEVSIMFVFQNGVDEENSKRHLSHFRHESFAMANTTTPPGTRDMNHPLHIQGISMQHQSHFTCGKPSPSAAAVSTEARTGEDYNACEGSSLFSCAASSTTQPKTHTDYNSFAIATAVPADEMHEVTITHCTKFQTLLSPAKDSCFGGRSASAVELESLESEHANELWKLFSSTGDIANLSQFGDQRSAAETVDGPTGPRYGAAICLRRRVPAGHAKHMQIALSWDYPTARFGSGVGLPRYYTRFFGRTGRAACSIAAYALQQSRRWESLINAWQADVIAKINRQSLPPQSDAKSRDYYYSQVFNELYFLVDGGAIWTDSTQGVSNHINPLRSSAFAAFTEGESVGVIAQQPPSDPATMMQRPSSRSNSKDYTGAGAGSALTSLVASLTTSSANTTHRNLDNRELELHKSLLDHSPSDTVSTTDVTPLSPPDGDSTTSAQTASHSLIFDDDLQRIYQLMQTHDLAAQHCGGNQQLVGQFLYLEGHEYLMYNTYDVHFYASFALIMLWPELELSLQRDIAHSVGLENETLRTMMGEGYIRPRKIKNVVPHDVGSPSETPWILPNVYNFQDVSNWKDLGPKFVLQIYRDVVYLQEHRYPTTPSNNRAQGIDTPLHNFLQNLYPVLLTVMRHVESFDINGDGMIENSGFPDQTYDIWTAKGTHAYCGGLWVTACEAMVGMATIMQDQPTAQHYARLAINARKIYIDHLWNAQAGYFHYDNSQSAHHDSIMSDMLAGQWYARACRLPDLVDASKILSALRTIYAWNVVSFGQGQLCGAVNGTKPKKDASTGRIVDMVVDSTCLQSREVWTGTTYALAATMLQEAVLSPEGTYTVEEIQELTLMAYATARGIHDAGWQRYGYWFATPEGWEQSGNYRSLGYMRALGIWAMQYALSTASTEADDGAPEHK